MKRRYWKGIAFAGLAGLLLAVASIPAFLLFDQFYPPPLDRANQDSVEVVDDDGKLLRAFVTSKGRWRLKTTISQIDPEFTKLLIAYEDQRFWLHSGVDILAMMRAVGQFVTNGHIVSGGSTITMQLARLLEPRKERSLSSKLLQVVRAIQIERRLSKVEILGLYLTLAPYGGNIEGIRAASLAYFSKEPKELTLAQSALLVALPQSPEQRRPDRFAKKAKRARNTVLTRAADAGVIALAEVARVAENPVPDRRIALPYYAAHLAQRLIRDNPEKSRHQITIKRGLQKRLEKVVREAARRLDPNVSVALIFADAKTGNILAEIGSTDYLDASRSGWMDMTRAIRSPGSALKPFIYGAAFEQGLIRPETLIMDSPANFAGYRPQNFDMSYQGEISIRRALQLSLNVPAVYLLDAVGPARIMTKFKRAGVKTKIPSSSRPGLAIGLGGIGISLRDLTQLYTAFANGGRINPLRTMRPPDSGQSKPDQPLLLNPDAAWMVSNILAGAPPPVNTKALAIAYKTGTSYGYRDAWSVGFDGRYVIGVWVGRPDNGSVPGITGRTIAAPILFEAFSKTGFDIVPLKSAPAGASSLANAELPVILQRFKTRELLFAKQDIPEPPPQIIYPPQGARIELGSTTSGAKFPLVLKIQDGRPPFRWMANGTLFSPGSRRRVATWQPDGAGYSKLSVVDASGRVANVKVFIVDDK